MLRRSSAPGPLAIKSGINPATKAIVVIKIGLKRSRFDCSIASCRGKPLTRNALVCDPLAKLQPFHNAEQN